MSARKARKAGRRQAWAGAGQWGCEGRGHARARSARGRARVGRRPGQCQTGAVITEARPAEETLRETEQPAKAVPDVGEGEPLIGTPSSKARHFAMPSSDGNPA